MTRPTHRLVREDGSEELVFAEGLDPATLEELPLGYWDETELAVARSIVWERVKALRSAAESGPAPTPLGPVQADDASKLKISGLVQLALLARAGGQPFREPFTMADNRVEELDDAKAIALGIHVGRYVSAVHAAARALRAWINDDARTAEELGGLDVDSAFSEALAAELAVTGGAE